MNKKLIHNLKNWKLADTKKTEKLMNDAANAIEKLQTDLYTVAHGYNGLIEGDDPHDDVMKILKKYNFWDEDGFWIGDDE